MKMKKVRRLISILMLLTIMVSVPATSVHAEGNVGRVVRKVGTISQAYTGGNSQVYAHLITRADGTEVRYVYSKNYLCSNSPEDTFAALKSVLTADYAALIPDSVDASLNGSVGFFFCSDPSLEQYVNDNWTSAEYVARNVLTIPEEGMSYSYKREENGAGGAVNTSATAARKNNRFEWIKTLAEEVNRLEWEAIQEYPPGTYVPLDFGNLTGDDIQGTRDLTDSQIDLAVGCNFNHSYEFESGQLVEVTNIEIIDRVATIYSEHTIISESSSDESASGLLIVEPADGAPECEAGGLSSEDIDAIAEAEGFGGAGAPDFALKLVVKNIDETVSAAEKEIAENYVASMGENVHIGMYTDMSLFLVGGGHRQQVTDLGGRNLTVYMAVSGNLLAPAGFTRHFIAFQIHNGAVTEVGRSTTGRVPITAGRFSTYVLAYYDVEDGGSSSHEHNHHICENGHKFAYCVMQAPTTEVDGFAEWRCTQCGIYDWNDHDNADARETVILSAYPVFNDTLESNIKAAEAGATVCIETKRWASVRRGVLEALAEKPGVTLSIKFEKEGSDYVLTIPGGDPILAGILVSEDRFFSFNFLGNTYGLTAAEK